MTTPGADPTAPDAPTLVDYLQDNVAYTSPSATQSDYQAVISIVFQVRTAGILSPPYVYNQSLTGYSDIGSLIRAFQDTRKTITDASLITYSQGTPTLYSPLGS